MTLGQKIFELRNKQKMSQGDLAEKLNVSRQSISKWETDASIPELDKLIMLSDLFNITIDELVRDELPEMSTDEVKATPKRSHETVVISKQMSTQKIIGFILLGAGIICLPMLYLMGPGALIFSAAFIFFSLICFFIKKYAGLIIAWIITAIAEIIFETGTSSGLFWSIIYVLNGFHNVSGFQIIVSSCIWIWTILLTVLTVRAIKRKKLIDFKYRFSISN